MKIQELIQIQVLITKQCGHFYFRKKVNELREEAI